jgi:hypothetical protein
MKKNRWEIGIVVFGGIFEIRSKDGSTFVVAFSKRLNFYTKIIYIFLL